jgi:hypothetical protein
MNLEEFEASIAEKVANNSMTMDEGVEAIRNFTIESMSQRATPRSAAAPASVPSFIEQLMQQNTNPLASRPMIGEPQATSNQDLAFVLGDTSTPPLLRESVQTEVDARDQLAEQPFGEAITNPMFWDRVGRAGAKGPTQLINGLVNGLPMLGGLIGEQLGSEGAGDFAERQMEDFTNVNEGLNNLVGSSDPVRFEESLAENLMGALVPGGLFAKGLGVAADFTVEQTIRELTDTNADDYNTAFDRLGLTNDGQYPALGPLAAIGGAFVGGALGTSAITRLVNKNNLIPTARPLTEIDPDAPAGIVSTERASDLTYTNLVDEQQALRTMLERDGISGFDDVSSRIEFETHSAARSRAQEGLRTGRLTTMDGSFEVPVAPRVLYDGYYGLTPEIRKDVSDYINSLDMLDDARLARTNNLPGNHGQTIAMLNRQISGIEQRTPLAQQFARDYRSITSGLRDFSEGSLFNTPHRQQLDIDRPNYVPLEISNVDTSAPFLQRMRQAQTDQLPEGNSEWFLQRRNSAGNYDLSTRADPMDMLMQYSESVLLARMKNDTRIAAIDGMLNSQVNGPTIRRAEENEAGLHADRTISVIRNGDRETYITSSLKAALLRFDPYVAKNPALYGIKRLAETAMVGPLSLTFAPVTFLRDAVGGMVTRAEGSTAGSLYGSTAAIPRQVWAKAQGQISRSLQARLLAGDTPIPTSVMSREAQQSFADGISQSYLNSAYHQMNLAGGFDASLMASKVRAGTETFQELSRSIATSPVINNPIVNNLVTRFGARTVDGMLKGFVTLFNTIQDAPRFAAIEATVRQTGMDIGEATRLGRQLTGDASKSGRVYDPNGVRMNVDAVDQGVLNLSNKYIGTGIEVVRENFPFFNPMVQGLNNLQRSFSADPIGTNLRAWKTVGVPALAAYGWNEMLGQEYNDYAMDRRSSRDVAMTMYFGVPGLPPEQGIEIPIMHELLFFNSPFTQSLHGLARSEDPEMTSRAMQILSSEILSNSMDVGFPIAGALLTNFQGMNAADSVLAPTEGVYSLRDDNMGFLPANLEAMIRTTFASVGDTAIDLAYSMAQPDGDYDFKGFLDQTLNSVVRRAPIVRNLAGARTANIYRSIPSAIKADKYQAYTDVRGYWDEFYNPDRATTNDFDKPASRRTYTSLDNYTGETDLGEDLPFMMIGPERMVEPTNPYIERFGEILKDNLGSNDAGMSGLRNRESIYGKYVRQLSDYGVADQQKLSDWYNRLMTAEGLDSEELGVRDILVQHEIDLTDYSSRVRLINILENERSHVIAAQLNVIAQVENQITEILRSEGVLGPSDTFDITKHLKPYDADPFNQEGATTNDQ